MKTKQLALVLGIFLASSVAYAEKIQFINGDSLDVLLIRHTSSTITFSHISLGEVTINKVKISNLQALNLESLKKEIQAADEKSAVAEVSQEAVSGTQVANAIQAAQEKSILARENVDAAKEQLVVAQENLKVAEIEDIEIAEQAVVGATAKVKATEQALIMAVDDIDAVAKNAEIAKKVKIASVDVAAANDEVKLAKENLKEAREGVRDAKKQLRYSEEADAADEVIDVADERIDIAEEVVVVAEEQVKVAEEKVGAAEDKVKLAKGEKIDDGFMGTGWFKGWDSSVELGMKGSRGSSVNSTFRTAFNTRYEDSKHRWDFKSFYLLDSEDNVTGENQLNAVLVKDWFFADTRWFAYASVTYDWNQFKDWDHRLQLSVGPGYQFVKTDEWEFSGRVAGTGIMEFNKTQYDAAGDSLLDIDGNEVEKNVLGFEAMLGADLTWHITAKQHFTLSNYFYPSLTDAGEFRNLTNLAWTHDIDWFEGLAIKFGIRNEYNTAESIPNEFKYNFSLLWGF